LKLSELLSYLYCYAAIEFSSENVPVEISESSDDGLLDFNEPNTDAKHEAVREPVEAQESEEPPLASFLDDFSDNSRLEREEMTSEPVNKVVPLPTPNVGSPPPPKASTAKPVTPQVTAPPSAPPSKPPPSPMSQSIKPKSLPPPPPLKRKVG
jgi:hypothetical protein